MLVLAAFDAAPGQLEAAAVTLDGWVTRLAPEYRLRVPLGVDFASVGTLALIYRIVVRQSFGKRQPLPVVIAIDLRLADVLDQLVLLVLLPLVVLIQPEPALFRHGGHPLSAEAAGEDAQNAEDEE